MSESGPRQLRAAAATAALLAMVPALTSLWILSLPALAAAATTVTGETDPGVDILKLKSVLLAAASIAAIAWYIVLGILRGWRPARLLGVVEGCGLAGTGIYVAVVAGALGLGGPARLGVAAVAIGAGVAMIGLLLGPRSSRRWFDHSD